jgi:hypothetical protein
MEQRPDDGSLAFLKIQPDANNRHFNCPETNQQKLINLRHYFRYADDIVILSSDKPQLHTLLNDIRDYFGDLKLEVKSNWQIFPVASRGIDFVGYVFFHTHTRMRKSIKKTFCRRIAKLRKRKFLTEKEFKQSICPWWGWAKYCDSKNLISKLSKNSMYEIKFRRKTA